MIVGAAANSMIRFVVSPLPHFTHHDRLSTACSTVAEELLRLLPSAAQRSPYSSTQRCLPYTLMLRRRNEPQSFKPISAPKSNTEGKNLTCHNHSVRDQTIDRARERSTGWPNDQTTERPSCRTRQRTNQSEDRATSERLSACRPAAQTD